MTDSEKIDVAKQITINMRWDELPDPVRKDFLNDVTTEPTKKMKLKVRVIMRLVKKLP